MIKRLIGGLVNGADACKVTALLVDARLKRQAVAETLALHSMRLMIEDWNILTIRVQVLLTLLLLLRRSSDELADRSLMSLHYVFAQTQEQRILGSVDSFNFDRGFIHIGGYYDGIDPSVYRKSCRS